jgi:uncharacterized protein (TIGR03643 family)
LAKEVATVLGIGEVLQPTLSLEKRGCEVRSTKREFTDKQTDRIIQMAWEDRTPFEAIREQFGLSPGDVIHFMRANMKPSSFRMWRKRTGGRQTKHIGKHGFRFGRFRCRTQKG